MELALLDKYETLDKESKSVVRLQGEIDLQKKKNFTDLTINISPYLTPNRLKWDGNWRDYIQEIIDDIDWTPVEDDGILRNCGKYLASLRRATNLARRSTL